MDGKSSRADYVLSGDRGPLCVLEAKRPDLDTYDAKEQARGYAENLRALFVILSNEGHDVSCPTKKDGQGYRRTKTKMPG